MLKNSNIGYDWIFKIILGYHDLIFLISVVLLLVFVVVVVVVVVFEAREYKRIIFSESSAVFMGCSRTWTKQVQNSLTVHDNSRTLKFHNFSEFQNVINVNPPAESVIMTHRRTKIDLWLNQPLHSLFFIVCQGQCYQNIILKLSCIPLAFTSYKAFWIN